MLYTKAALTIFPADPSEDRIERKSVSVEVLQKKEKEIGEMFREIFSTYIISSPKSNNASNLQKARRRATISSRPSQTASITSSFAREKVQLPDIILKPLMQSFQKQELHPNVFTRAYDFFASQYEINIFPDYSKYVNPAGLHEVQRTEGESSYLISYFF